MSSALSERTPLRAVVCHGSILTSLAMALCLTGLHAQQPDRPGFRVERWHIQDGLPQATVSELMIGSDGLLRIGTQGGLCRFDGEGIRVIDPVQEPGMPSRQIGAIFEAADGSLWVGTRGHGVARFAAGAWRPVDNRRYGGVFAIHADAEGRVAISCSLGLFRQDDGKLRRVARPETPPVKLANGPDGQLYGVSKGGLVRILHDRIELVRNAYLGAIARRGDHLLVAGQRGVGVLDGDRIRWLSLGLGRGMFRDLLCDRDGGVWIAGYSGVAHVDAATFDRALAGEDCLAETDLGIPEELALSLCEDPEGGIWVGFERSGLARLRRATIRVHDIADGLPPERLTTVTNDPEHGLLVTSRLGLMRRSNSRFEQLAAGSRLRLLLKDSSGQIWLAQQDKLCVLKHGRPIPYPLVKADEQKRDLRAFGSLRTMVELADGRLWVFGSRAILEIDNGKARRVRAFDKLDQGAITRAVAASDGAVWVGGPNALTRHDPTAGSLQVWRCGYELPVGEIRTILPEAGANAWVASYGGGVLRIEAGGVRAVDESHGLLDQSLCALAPFGDSMFAASNRGCFAVALDDLQAVATGNRTSLACRMLDAEGEFVNECNGGQQQNIAVDDRGHYWVCGVHGLYEFDPTWLQPRPRELQPFVQQLVIGDTEWPNPEGAKPDATARTLSLRLSVNAFDDHDRVRFQWRAPGIHPEWSPPSYEREIRVDGLPSGEICIEALAVDVDGSVSREPLRVTFELPARIWETSVFWVAAPLMLASLIWLLVRAFSARERRRAVHLQTVVDGRTRELVEARDRLEEHVEDRTRKLHEALALSEQESEQRHRLERELNDLRLSEAIGKLAGGVAHDFNNLLTVTLGSGELLQYEVESESALELVRNIVAASARGRSLTQHLLAVASRQVVRPEPLVLQDVLQEIVPVLRPLLGEDTELRLDVTDERAVVRGAVTQIEQILINLTANSRDAIAGAGTVTIAIDVVGNLVTLSVTDDGSGMTDDVREKAFDPFYTTKDSEGIGRGLGLATVFGITKQLGGDIEIDSRIDQGTTIRVLLPRTQEAADAPSVMICTPEELAGRVLLIEDQAAVREVLRRQLVQLGCTVETATDGDTAIAMLDQGLQIDVVVSDVVMPGLQGAALVEAMRAQVADLPCVFISGYMDGRRAHTDIASLGFPVLAKPVDAAELARALARHLSSSSNPH